MWEGKLHDPPLAETDEQVVSAHGENPRPLAPTDFYDRSKGIRWAPCTHSPGETAIITEADDAYLATVASPESGARAACTPDCSGR